MAFERHQISADGMSQRQFPGVQMQPAGTATIESVASDRVAQRLAHMHSKLMTSASQRAKLHLALTYLAELRHGWSPNGIQTIAARTLRIGA